ncbi:hypothetical protein AJ78_06490 [Emergomyces pasteurianus Ep9510]|uniref:Uncharacterized protein n=1 Tax=Emergomyces pasteurianus Ep9510 TaxID=1447872 RepID=A0A1J9QCV3_9EURO|nr:hypothetical protein AJ78_06490 [Emergomyces pasteurianus Ep9510]
MEMFNNILKQLSKPQHDSYVMLIVSPEPARYQTAIHIVPEDPSIIERTQSTPPRLPHSVSVRSRVPLGNLTTGILKGQDFTDALKQLTELVRKAYDDITANSKNDVLVSSDAVNDSNEKILRRCEHALRQGFSLMMASEQKQEPRAAPRVYAVDLARISRSRPGRIWDDSMMTSFPH